ncbi:unnamed protein product [Chironomus riparius]|uniref:Dolichyl-diphosphooligosaccharide-protein glycosyltransferase subunit TMEM258 n=1 Tax=Chironomus riparius TaxID=315576 RepID=A0A9N9WR83_9DIPT|nr:unnamed protein product [Chironomus riparius]
MDSMVRYASPINPAIYPHLATVLSLIGILLASWFFVFEVSRPKDQKERVIFKELSVSLISSIFLGFGILFIFLSAGIYV